MLPCNVSEEHPGGACRPQSDFHFKNIHPAALQRRARNRTEMEAEKPMGRLLLPKQEIKVMWIRVVVDRGQTQYIFWK